MPDQLPLWQPLIRNDQSIVIGRRVVRRKGECGMESIMLQSAGAGLREEPDPAMIGRTRVVIRLTVSTLRVGAQIGRPQTGRALSILQPIARVGTGPMPSVPAQTIHIQASPKRMFQGSMGRRRTIEELSVQVPAPEDFNLPRAGEPPIEGVLAAKSLVANS
jgi:hypothetical protein